MKTSTRSAFTLIELLVCVVIIAVLTSIAIPIISGARKKSSMAREISSARNIITSYLTYAADHDGELMAGYGNFPAKDDKGNKVKSPVNQRYPWRLAPYVKYDMRVFWGNEADDRITELAKRGPYDSYVYAVSVEPALGINSVFVGGDSQILPPDNAKALAQYGQFCMTRLPQASNASQLIVFASAAGFFEGQKMTGYFRIQAPNFITRNWVSEYNPKDDPALHGNVDFRYEDKAVVAMLDGHVEMMDFDQMNDMRHWSNQAANAEVRGWVLGGAEDGGGTGIVSAGGHVTTKPNEQQP